MKKSSLLVILVPILIALLVVVFVGASRFKQSVSSNVSEVPAASGNLPSLTGNAGAPQKGFSDMSAQPVSDLRKSFDTTEFSDTSDIESLSKDAASL